MNQPAASGPWPSSEVAQPTRRVSIVWIIPVVAALVAAGIFVKRVLDQGPTITIVFNSAEGIEPGKTFVKYKEVNIGQVTAVQLSTDFGKVEVQAKIAKKASGLMKEDAKFWVVRPRISAGGVSGLATLLSGNYIGFDAGRSDKERRSFTGLEAAPITSGGAPGHQYVLKADELGSLQVGSPVYFRRLPVGRVVAYDLAADGKTVDIKVFVGAPYDRYVSAATQFWNASGIDVSMGAGGLDIRTESLAALIAGGVAFDTPPNAGDGAAAAENSAFVLRGDRSSAMKQPPAFARSYVLHFAGSVRGLSVGAPVTFLGLPAGEVTSVSLALDPRTLDVSPLVRIIVYPEQLIARADDAAEKRFAKSLANNVQARHALLRRLVEERGLHAQLQNSSLLTGQMYVALEYFPQAPKSKVDWSREAPELPVMPGALPDIESKLASIIEKVDRLPIDSIGKRVDADLATLDDTLRDARRLIGSADAHLLPQLQRSLEGVDRLTSAAHSVMKNADAGLLAPGAPAQQELRDTLQELGQAARSLRTLTDYLEQHPESILRGKQK